MIVVFLARVIRLGLLTTFGWRCCIKMVQVRFFNFMSLFLVSGGFRDGYFTFTQDLKALN
jgi:hypothetical protein